jgi:hypothetical protein
LKDIILWDVMLCSLLELQIFWRNIPPPSLGSKSKLSNQQETNRLFGIIPRRYYFHSHHGEALKSNTSVFLHKPWIIIRITKFPDPNPYLIVPPPSALILSRQIHHLHIAHKPHNMIPLLLLSVTVEDTLPWSSPLKMTNKSVFTNRFSVCWSSLWWHFAVYNVNPHLTFLWEAAKMNTKLRKISNGGNLSQRFMITENGS